MDTALRDILREEKRRQKSRKDQPKSSNNNKQHSKPRSKERSSNHKSSKSHRRHKSENDSKSIEFIPQKATQTQTHNEPVENVLMFLYEDSEGKLHRDLDSIEKVEGATAKIFPVYVHGSHDNFTEEEIVYREKWTSETEGSWLEWMTNPEFKLTPFEGEQVVIYNDKLFHCEGDLLEYLQEFGPEVMSVE